jgi:hypothetical protein
MSDVLPKNHRPTVPRDRRRAIDHNRAEGWQTAGANGDDEFGNDNYACEKVSDGGNRLCRFALRSGCSGVCVSRENLPVDKHSKHDRKSNQPGAGSKKRDPGATSRCCATRE